MAKMRVYELARDLNLTNKILLSKLNDMDISVKSHMSALDDDTVATIKNQLFGKKFVNIFAVPDVVDLHNAAFFIHPVDDPETAGAKRSVSGQLALKAFSRIWGGLKVVEPRPDDRPDFGVQPPDLFKAGLRIF